MNNKYIVYSRGMVLPGFDKESVANKLSVLFAKQDEYILSRLLGNNTQKIKSFNDAISAEGLEKKLIKLGLDCFISVDGGEEEIVKVAPPEASKRELRINNNSKVWLLLAVIVLSVAIIAVFKWPFKDLPSSVNQAEVALFESQEPSLMMHADLTQLRRFYSVNDFVAFSKKMPSALSNPPLFNTHGDLSSLFLATDFITASASTSETTDLDNSSEASRFNSVVILLGDFSDLNLVDEFSKLYVIEAVDGDILTLKKQLKKSIGLDFVCPGDESDTNLEVDTYASLTSQKIVLSSSKEDLLFFNAAYEKNKENNSIELQQWQSYRGQSLAAISLLDQQILKENYIAQAASNALLEDSTYRSIGSRITTSIIKKSLDISFDIDMGDQVAIDEIASKIENGINELSVSNKDYYPSVVDLLSRVDVRSDDGFHLTLSINEKIISEIETLASDFFSMMFSPTLKSDTSQEVLKEELEKNVWDHTLNKKVLLKSKLPSSDFDYFEPVFTHSNTSIYLDSVGVKPISSFDKELGTALQLQLTAKRLAEFGDAFLTWSSSGIKQSLSIVDVLDNNGNNMLADERCLETKFNQNLNHQPNNSTSYQNGIISTSKKVRLIDSARIDTIHSIKGQYLLTVPVNVSTKKITLGDSLVEWSGGSFKLTQMSGGSISYGLIDEESRLIDVRGLNAKGLTLSSGSSFWSGNKYTKRFKGEVRSVELVIADKVEERKFNFTVETITPKPIVKKNVFSHSNQSIEPTLFIKEKNIARFSNPFPLKTLNENDKKIISDKLNWSRVSLDASKDFEIGNELTKSTVIFFKHDHESRWRNELTGFVVLPFEESLQSSDDLVNLSLELDGEAYEPVDLEIKPNLIINGKPRPAFTIGKFDYSTSVFSIALPEDAPQIKKITGVLKYILPTELSIETVAFDKQVINSPNIILDGYDFTSRGSVTYKLSEKLATAYFIKVTSVDGVESRGRIKTDDNIVTVEVEEFKEVEKMDFYYIDKSHLINEKIEFTPVYK